MAILMRAPEECASWEWELNDFAQPGLDSALMVAARMSDVLRKHRLLEPGRLAWDWTVFGRGGTGLGASVALWGALDGSELAQRVRAAQPASLPEAEPGFLVVSGAGTWLDAQGEARSELGLLELTVYPDERNLAAEVAVFHDIWGYCDFKGVPHPEVQERNAPRLAAALRELDALLGVPARPGDPTYFGHAEGHGLVAPDLIDGLGPDLTDKL
ncbi:hypothetical protein [Streptomyces sp. MJP52]|uniref:hypothetical protein n=1 Tax=Streptomyces sp. MJP52 TaxID=2940555 RepID=UPI002476F32D|nr:hypothetical protein [Streptomyces sp. MJP52]MDH6227250.1 hypothetical protein [Streptomyces sp. MJP52]